MTLTLATAHPQTPPYQVSEQDFLSEGFWRQTFPELTIIGRLTGDFALNILAEPAMVVTGQKMLVEGYFQERDPQLVEITSLLSTAVSRCVQLGIPPVFIFLFDEAWASFFRQHATIAALLGAQYQTLPDFWAWHVDPQAGQAGWRPHRDKGRISLAPDGSPLSLTIWIPLTEATPLNGCMYMLPANRDPVYNTENDKSWQVDYPSIRALPGQPGDWFCWNQAVLHWGAQSSPFATNPRMSMALEFQRSDMTPFNTPQLGMLPVLNFESRLRLVAKQILQYQHMYPLPEHMQRFARGVIG
jgi:hypothetical protein